MIFIAVGGVNAEDREVVAIQGFANKVEKKGTEDRKK